MMIGGMKVWFNGTINLKNEHIICLLEWQEHIWKTFNKSYIIPGNEAAQISSMLLMNPQTSKSVTSLQTLLYI